MIYSDSSPKNGYSSKSTTHPEINEDAFFVDSQLGIAGVFDGVGGLSGSDEAARNARDTAADALGSIAFGAIFDGGPQLTKQNMKEALLCAHNNIRNIRNGNNIATTAVIAAIISTPEDSDTAGLLLAWAGDSRAYLANRDGGWCGCVTLDHGASRCYGLSKEAVKATQNALDEVSSKDNWKKLSDHDKKMWQLRNRIYSSLGNDEHPRIDTLNLKVPKGTDVILTTDGVHDNLTCGEIASFALAQGGCKDLVEFAVRRSKEGHFRSKPDDTTAVLLRVK